MLLVTEQKYGEIEDCNRAQQLKVGASTSYLTCLQVDFRDHPFKLCQFQDDLQSNQGNGILDLKTAHYERPPRAHFPGQVYYQQDSREH